MTTGPDLAGGLARAIRQLPGLADAAGSLCLH